MIKNERQYRITNVPRFLIFAPGGELVHGGAGGLTVEEVLALAADAQDTARQYYVQLER